MSFDLFVAVCICCSPLPVLWLVSRLTRGNDAALSPVLKIESAPAASPLTLSAAALALDNAPPRRRAAAPPQGVPMAAVSFAAAVPEVAPAILMRSAQEILGPRYGEGLSCWPTIHQAMLMDPVRREHETELAGPIIFRGVKVGEGRRCRLCSKVLTWPKVCA